MGLSENQDNYILGLSWSPAQESSLYDSDIVDHNSNTMDKNISDEATLGEDSKANLEGKISNLI